MAQTARFLFLRGVWRRLNSSLNEALAGPPVSQVRSAGVGEDVRLERSPVVTWKARMGASAMSIRQHVKRRTGSAETHSLGPSDIVIE